MLDPHDPNQFEDEEIQYIVAMYRSLSESCEAAAGAPISPAQAMELLNERSREYATNVLFLQDIRLSEVYVMMRDSERCNSTELFFSAVRLALPVFCVTNASHYVRICVELLLWRATASPAEVLLFAEAGFTRLTKNGKRRFTDKVQEMVNQIFRGVVGDCVRPGLVHKMMSTALSVEKFTQTQGSIAKMKSIERDADAALFNHSAVPVDDVYVKVRLSMYRGKFWDRGQQVLVGCNEQDLRPARCNFVESPKGELMPAEIIRSRSIGIERLRWYIDRFYLKTRYSVERPCKGADGVPLGRIGCLASDYREKGYREIKLLTSMSSAELIKYAKKKKLPLETELSRCLAELGDDVPASARLTVTPRTWQRVTKRSFRRSSSKVGMILLLN